MEISKKCIVAIVILAATAIIFSHPEDSEVKSDLNKENDEVIINHNDFLESSNLGSLFELTGTSVRTEEIKGDGGRYFEVKSVNGTRLQKSKIIRLWINERSIFEIVGPRTTLRIPDEIAENLKITGFLSGAYHGIPQVALDHLKVSKKQAENSWVPIQKFAFEPQFQVISIEPMK